MRGVGAGRSAERACARSSDWPQGGAVYPEARLAARSGQRSPYPGCAQFRERL